MPRIVLIPLVVLLLLVVTAAVLVPMLLDKDKVLGFAATTLEEKTGAILTVDGDVTLSLFPVLGVALQEAAIAMPGEDEPGLRTRSLSIGVQMMPLLSGSVEVNSIEVDGLQMRIVSAAVETPVIDTSTLTDQELDAFYARRQEAMRKAGEVAGAEAALALPMALNVGQLSITDSRLETVDGVTGESSVVELLRVEASGLNLDGKAIPLEADVRLPGEQPVEINLRASIVVDQEGQMLDAQPLDVQVTGATPEPLKLRTNGEMDLSRQLATLQLELELGDTRGNGSLRYAGFESPQIDAELKLNLLDPALLVLAGPEAAAEAGPEAASASGDDPLPLDAIRKIDTRAVLDIERAVFGAHAIEGAHVRLRAVDGIVNLNKVSGSLHGGAIDLRATLNGKHNTAQLNTAGKVQGLDIATALAAMESRPIFSGAANLDWKLAAKGRTANELLGALTGPITAVVDDPVLKGIAVERMLCQAVALVNQQRLSASFPPDSRFTALDAEIRLADGKMQLKPLRAELAEIKLGGSGLLDLFSQDFKATFKARLSPELAQLDPACQVDKRLTSIDWPVSCKGQISGDPAKWCGVDTEAIITDMAKQEAGRRIEKEAGKLMDKLFR
jgi:uncharacterized protein involved in outer membrane biogenesis